MEDRMEFLRNWAAFTFAALVVLCASCSILGVIAAFWLTK